MGHFWKAFLTALIGSVLVNLILLFILRPFVINAALPLHALAVGPVLSFTIGGVVAAVIVYAVMRAMLVRPQTPYVILSVIVLLLSFIPDVMIIGATSGPFAGGTLANASVLMLMHVATALITVSALVKMWGSRAGA